MTCDEANLDVVVMLAAEGVVRIRADLAEGGREGRVPIVEGAAFLGARIAKLRCIGTVFPFEARGEISGGFPLEEVRLGFPEGLHFLGVVIGREAGVLVV